MHKKVSIQNIKFSNKLQKQFFTRVFSTPKKVYDKRIKQINFVEKNIILDAGCGYGQWIESLNDLNQEVHGIDIELEKLKIAVSLFKHNEKKPKFYRGSIENLPFQDNTFDAIFSYSVLYFTDYKKTLKEFFRVLKPSGTVYFVTNGLGWSLFNLFSGHSSAPDFNARIYALQTIFSTIKYSITKKRDIGQSHFMSKKSVRDFMYEIGFKNIIVKEEGNINLNKSISNHSFYKKKFFGITNVFEVLAHKK